jgi:hypothetical protein
MGGDGAVELAGAGIVPGWQGDQLSAGHGASGVEQDLVWRVSLSRRLAWTLSPKSVGPDDAGRAREIQEWDALLLRQTPEEKTD